MNPTLILDLPSKFYGILQTAVKNEIQRMQVLLEDDTTPEMVLAEMDYGNDQWILKMIADDLANPNHYVETEFYQLSTNADSTEYTLTKFGKPISDNEKRLFVFSATDYNQAMAIRNQFLGFEPYKPF
ncbi:MULTISPECIES: hypothetical protein [unclassified Moraxella]|uniref:hypothetical protein n=1 Tax=unclassified Moraxella TaxID=2685852 RepID=UPI003AF8FC47